jgi:hypothetical protein
MKNFVTQGYQVTLTDGSTHVVCCAPEMISKFSTRIKAYTEIGTAKYDVCHHKGRAADICRKQNAELRAKLHR